ncbi:transcription initiation factor TFIID subunit 9-like [Suncus etruscus]|uniref:transcription initiation factor TFIID subunit 9-like n=1 Tax=Suncus etruscus TaxID=109475 RepID=UPI00210F8BB5|nr:transcription initiation factor TFIID subunit 9-like [Suncus etruscus]
MAFPKNMPKDAEVVAQILKDMGVTDYEPRVINQLLEFAFRYVTTILEDAKVYSGHAKKATVDADDVRLAIQCQAEKSFTSPPPRAFLLDIARQRNQIPLPLIKLYSGPRLPPDRYCLTAPNYRLKSLQNMASTSAGGITSSVLSVGSGTTSGTPTPQTMYVATKSGAPISFTGQRCTVQRPISQTPARKASIPGKASIRTASTVQNVSLNPSLIGFKNTLITKNMVSSQNTARESSKKAVKRKRKNNDNHYYKF